MKIPRTPFIGLGELARGALGQRHGGVPCAASVAHMKPILQSSALGEAWD
mgnify:CR=1 FL=1